MCVIVAMEVSSVEAFLFFRGLLFLFLFFLRLFFLLLLLFLLLFFLLLLLLLFLFLFLQLLLFLLLLLLLLLLLFSFPLSPIFWCSHLFSFISSFSFFTFFKGSHPFISIFFVSFPVCSEPFYFLINPQTGRFPSLAFRLLVLYTCYPSILHLTFSSFVSLSHFPIFFLVLFSLQPAFNTILECSFHSALLCSLPFLLAGLVSTLSLLCSLNLYPLYVLGSHHQLFSLVLTPLYCAVFFLCSVLLTVALVIVGLINSLLSARFWIPLSRLTYSAYLLHPIVLSAVFGSFQHTAAYTTQLFVSVNPSRTAQRLYKLHLK